MNSIIRQPFTTWAPRFGFGGRDEKNHPRPLPQPEEYRLTLKKSDLKVLNQHRIRLCPSFVDEVYHRIFRQSLKEPGSTLITGLSSLMNSNMQKVRTFQVELGQQLAQRRSNALEIETSAPFSLKYLGRSNKAKKNPMHFDTKSTDSFVLMTYEPAQNIKAYPFFTDLTQYAVDKGLDPLSLICQHNTANPLKDGSYKVKSHYGHQIIGEHQSTLLDYYTYDLKDLNLDEIQLVVFNDSLGLSNKGLTHGMRQMEIPNPGIPSQRYFNHLVIDVQNREVCRPAENQVSPNHVPTYYEKGIEESKQQPVSVQTAIKHYIDTGKIYYRNPNF